MKKIKILLTVIISILVLNIKVDAATGSGICYEREIKDSSGYCELDSGIKIDFKTFSYRPIMLNTGAESVKYGFHGIIEGKDQDMFCIDSNLSEPGTTLYKFARPFNLNNDYDRAIAKVYSMYVNDTVWLMNVTGRSLQDASTNYIQIANIVMRAITIKYQYDIVGAGSFRDNIFDNVYTQFEGKTAPNPKLIEGTDEYKLAQKYYCSAILSCKTCNKVADAKTYCSSVAGVSASESSSFKFTFNVNLEEIEPVGGSSDKFERIVPIKIGGLNNLLILYDSYKITNPNFYITKISCNNDKLTCVPVDGGLYSKNLLNDKPGAEYVIKVRVTGNKDDFKTESNARILIDYKYYHILDTNNLAVLRYSLTAQQKQRMIALMPSREQRAKSDIKINTPSMCEVRKEGDVPKYYYGGVEYNELTYMQKGCCNVDPGQIKNEDAFNFYVDNCAMDDIVDLNTKCDNDKNLYNVSKSTVKQQPIDKIMKLVSTAEESYNKLGSYSFNQLKEQLKKTDNNRDDIYIYNATDTDSTIIAASNDYCKLYTSEELVIEYPGTVEATSGRFFVFDEGEQPKVTGKIYGNFHTDYDRWKNDYDNAVTKEREAYTDWQTALAAENARGKLEPCYESGTCSCCCGYDYTAEGKRYCVSNDCCSTKYAGSNYADPDAGKFYTADENDLANIVTAYRSCGCANSGRDSVNVSVKGSSSSLEIKYKNLKNERIKLKNYKIACESKSEIETKWKYYLEPDLQFTYKQEYYDSVNDKAITTKETVDFKVSTKAEKYWPKVSTSASQISGSKTGRSTPVATNVIYGGGTSKEEDYRDYDTTKDYQIGYQRTLYYMPTTKYYSLLPNGKYLTDITSYSSGSYLDIGYVFNVEITNYKNRYYTWFTINNTGHLMQNPKITPKLKSNVQKSIDKKVEEINDPELLAIYNNEDMDKLLFNNVCYYDDEEILYQRDCPTCSDDNAFKPQYFYRTIAGENLFPNEGVGGRKTGPNWSNDKGKSARKKIEDLGTEIYNDITKEYLEYSFVFSPLDMQTIKKENKKSNYSDFNLKCNTYGKECESSLLTEWAKKSKTEDILYNTRNNGWKYYITKGGSAQWSKGRINTLLPGGYPEETSSLNIWP